jgi:hypothetical protein
MTFSNTEEKNITMKAFLLNVIERNTGRTQWLGGLRPRSAAERLLLSSSSLFTVGVEDFDFSFDHTQAHTTFGRTPLDEGSARRRDLYLTTQTLYKTNAHSI